MLCGTQDMWMRTIFCCFSNWLFLPSSWGTGTPRYTPIFPSIFVLVWRGDVICLSCLGAIYIICLYSLFCGVFAPALFYASFGWVHLSEFVPLLVLYGLCWIQIVVMRHILFLMSHYAGSKEGQIQPHAIWTPSITMPISSRYNNACDRRPSLAVAPECSIELAPSTPLYACCLWHLLAQGSWLSAATCPITFAISV